MSIYPLPLALTVEAGIAPLEIPRLHRRLLHVSDEIKLSVNPLGHVVVDTLLFAELLDEGWWLTVIA